MAQRQIELQRRFGRKARSHCRSVAPGRYAKQPTIIARELRWALVSCRVTDGSHISFHKQQPTRFLQANLFLELEGRERRHGLEAPMEARNAHMRQRREISNPQRLGESITNEGGGAAYARGVTFSKANLT